MKFLKTLLAATLGTFLAFFLIIIILVITISSSTEEPEPYVRDNTVLKINLSGDLPDRISVNPFDKLLNRDSDDQVSLETLKGNLTKAAADDHIKGVLLSIDFLSAGWANLEEAHKMINSFRDSSSKFIYATTNDIGYNEQGYYLATAADSVFSPPESFFEFDGFYSEVTFFTGLFEKIGVDAEVTRHGKYKGAVEPYFRKDLSKENKYQLQQLVNNISNTFVKAVSVKTGMSEDEINSLLNNQPSLIAHYGYKHGLIDSLMYAGQVDSLIKKRIGLKKDQSYHTISNGRYAKVSRNASGLQSGTTDNKIAVLYASGTILPDANTNSPFDNTRYITTSFFKKQLEDIRKDKHIKALVLRINSPGGSGSTSDAIWKMLKETKKNLPLIVSMGPVAASGGYYIASIADTIVAEPTTITGSIGVFATKFNAKQLFNDKLGITFDDVKSHDHADWLTATRGFTPSEQKAFQQYINGFYNTFIAKVASSRSLTKEQVDKIGQGRVWIGSDAKEQKLVDVLGGLDNALQIAAKKAGIGHYGLVTYPKHKDIYQLLMGSVEGQAKMIMGDSWFFNKMNTLNSGLEMVKTRGPLTIFPYNVNVH